MVDILVTKLENPEQQNIDDLLKGANYLRKEACSTRHPRYREGLLRLLEEAFTK